MKEIKLKPHGIAFVDDDNFESLSKYKWYLSRLGYAIGGEKSDGKKAFVKMHRFIMNIDDPKIKIDHIDGNKLNNQKSNLRIATPAQNMHNSKKRDNTKNKYKGVNYLPKWNLWQSRCRINGYDIFLGNYKSEIAAAYAYNKKALELSEFSRINYLPYDINYLESLLISDFRNKLSPIQSKYKYIKFRKKTNRMKCGKWYISFRIGDKWTSKGYFFTEDEALEYLIKNYSMILPDAGAMQDKTSARYQHLSKIQSPLNQIRL